MNLRVPQCMWRLAAALAVTVTVVATPSQAMPMFSRKYNLACAKCHSMVPRLTNFGYSFYKAGFRLPRAEQPPQTFANIASVLADIRFLNTDTPTNKDTGLDVTSAEIHVATAVDAHVSTHINYSFGPGSAQFGEAWVRGNAAPNGNGWEGMVGQIPVLDGFKLGAAANRDILITPAGIFNSLGSTGAALNLSDVERGVQAGYNCPAYSLRGTWMNGVDTAGSGSSSLVGQGRRFHDYSLQGEYLIGKEGSSIGAMAYHGQTKTPGAEAGSLYSNQFYRAGVFGSYSRTLKEGETIGIPIQSMDLNVAYVTGDDKQQAGNRTKARGEIVELDLYHMNQSALVFRYDGARPSDAEGTPTTRAFTIGLAHRPADYVRALLEYRRQRSPGANSVIGQLWFFY